MQVVGHIPARDASSSAERRFLATGDAMLDQRPSLVRATTRREGLKRVSAVQIDGLVMMPSVWCPAPVDQTVVQVRAATTVRQGLAVARSLGYACKCAA